MPTRLFCIIMCVLTISSLSFSFPKYSITLENKVQLDVYNFTFDIYIKSILGVFEITSYQSALQFDINLAKGGTLNFSYIDKSSELNNFPSCGIGLNNTFLTFASLPGIDSIGENKIKIGTFLLNSTKPFNGEALSIKWNFDGTFTTIITGSDFGNITVQKYFSVPESNVQFEKRNGPADSNAANLGSLELNNYKLSQNYPNPFNPSTNIKFQIPETGFVSLKIYDALGRLVKTLVEKVLSSGVYIVTWNGNTEFGEKATSGIYFYKIESGTFAEIKKMILIK